MRTRIAMPTNGSAPGATSEKRTLKTELAVKRSIPKGGVAEPIAILVTTRIPRWIGLIPIASAAGKKIGIKIKTTEIGSINMQATNRMRFISIRK